MLDINSANEPILNSVVIIAIVMPDIPKIFPVLEVSGDDSPLNARIKKIPDTR